jgi:hypothetical protein
MKVVRVVERIGENVRETPYTEPGTWKVFSTWELLTMTRVWVRALCCLVPPFSALTVCLEAMMLPDSQQLRTRSSG